jgi:hypothetical protein
MTLWVAINAVGGSQNVLGKQFPLNFLYIRLLTAMVFSLS